MPRPPARSPLGFPGGAGTIPWMDTPRRHPLAQALRRPMHWVWAALLALCGGFWAWWERPAQEGAATLVLALEVAGLPEGSRGALWTGPTGAWRGAWDPGPAWRSAEGPRVAFPAHPVPIARRRFRQGLLLRRTHDLAVVLLEAPDGTRRYLAYDLREDLAPGNLRIGRPLGLRLSCRWGALEAAARVPEAARRPAVGY